MLIHMMGYIYIGHGTILFLDMDDLLVSTEFTFTGFVITILYITAVCRKKKYE